MAQKLERTVTITQEKLEGDLNIPFGAKAVILFAHGSGSSRCSQRNEFVAQVLNDAGIATLLVDLLTADEKKIDENTRHLRFDIDLLSRRLMAVTQWLLGEPSTSRLSIGYFGSSTGAAAALITAAKMNGAVKTIACRGGRPDLAKSEVLQDTTAPILLIVGGEDTPVIALNREAMKDLTHAVARELVVIPGAGHLFEEEGAMEQVARVALEWFECYLVRNGKKFENRYNQKRSRLPAIFKKRPHLQLRFKDRVAAGDVLAGSLGSYRDGQKTIVIGIPRGGVVVADRIARKLGADFDIVLSRRLRTPNDPEAAIGAIMEGDSVYVDMALAKSMNLSGEYVEAEKIQQKMEIERRKSTYRIEPRVSDFEDRTVILVDDGAATGATLIAAARWVRARRPRKLIVAIPVASPAAMVALRDEADEFVVIQHPANFGTVEQYYQDFSPVTDARVVKIVESYCASKR